MSVQLSLPQETATFPPEGKPRMSTTIAIQKLIRHLVRQNQLGMRDIFQLVDELLEGARALSALRAQSRVLDTAQEALPAIAGATVIPFPRKEDA